MSDFDKCTSIKCKLKYKCKRFMQRNINKYQWVTNFYQENTDCKHFKENK